MTDEYNTSTDLNMAIGEEDTEEAVVTNKGSELKIMFC